MNIVLTSASYRFGMQAIQFIVDTGSSKTFISEGDAFKLNMPMNSLQSLGPIRMGSGKYEILKTKPFSMYLKTEEEKTHKIDLSEFAVARTTKKTEDAKIESQNFPSILGTDFFLLHKMSLHFDPSREESYIEIKEQ